MSGAGKSLPVALSEAFTRHSSPLCRHFRCTPSTMLSFEGRCENLALESLLQSVSNVVHKTVTIIFASWSSAVEYSSSDEQVACVHSTVRLTSRNNDRSGLKNLGVLVSLGAYLIGGSYEAGSCSSSMLKLIRHGYHRKEGFLATHTSLHL